MIKVLITSLFAVVLGFLPGGGLGAKTYQIDPQRSQVKFEIVKYKIGAPVQGKFDQFSGSAVIVGNKIQGVIAKIKVASINTENDKRDQHLRSADFFGVDKEVNKTMIFKQTAAVTLATQFRLSGTLTLKGVTRPVVLRVERVSPVRLKARTKINKQDFGVTWNKPLEKSLWKRIKGVVGKTVIGEEVDIFLDINLR